MRIVPLQLIGLLHAFFGIDAIVGDDNDVDDIVVLERDRRRWDMVNLLLFVEAVCVVCFT